MEDTNKDKMKLVSSCKEKITEVFDGALSYIEVVLNKDEYSKVRSKILRIGNNAIRDLTSEILNHYDVKYDSNMVSVIKIKADANKEGINEEETRIKKEV